MVQLLITSRRSLRSVKLSYNQCGDSVNIGKLDASGNNFNELPSSVQDVALLVKQSGDADTAAPGQNDSGNEANKTQQTAALLFETHMDKAGNLQRILLKEHALNVATYVH